MYSMCGRLTQCGHGGENPVLVCGDLSVGFGNSNLIGLLTVGCLGGVRLLHLTFRCSFGSDSDLLSAYGVVLLYLERVWRLVQTLALVALGV